MFTPWRQSNNVRLYVHVPNDASLQVKNVKFSIILKQLIFKSCQVGKITRGKEIVFFARRFFFFAHAFAQNRNWKLKHLESQHTWMEGKGGSILPQVVCTLLLTSFSSILSEEKRYCCYFYMKLLRITIHSIFPMEILNKVQFRTTGEKTEVPISLQ